MAIRHYLYWSIAGLLFIIPFLPLYISGSMLFPFITGRNFTFRIITEIAFVLWLALATGWKEYRPKPSKLLGAVIAFVGVVFLADVFGVNPYRSFFSNYERMEGFMMIVHLGMYFTLLASIFRKKEDWKIFMNLFVAGSLLASLYALFQKLGFLKSIQGGVRVDGTIGNPTYLAAYLLLSMAVISILFWNSRQNWQRVLYALFFLFEALIILFTASRGVILASGIGGIAWLILFMLFAPSGQTPRGLKKYKIAAGIFLCVAVLVPVLFYGLRKKPFISKSPIFSRFANISLQEKTTRSRFMIWQMAYQGFQERPLLGWGQENFPAIFSKYYNPKLFDQEPWFDRSHNIIFDWLVHAGILGLTSYLTIFVFAGSALIRHIRSVRNDARFWLGGMTLGIFLIAYFLQNVLVFDNLNTYILFFALLAYIETLRRATESAPETKPIFVPNAAQKSASVLALGIILLIPVSYVINIKPIRQSRQLIHILQLNNTDPQPSPKIMEEEFRKALAYNSLGTTETREQLFALAGSVAGRKAPKEEQEAWYRFALAEAEKQREDIPLDVKYRMLLGSVYESGLQFDQTLIKKAEDNLFEAIRMSPGKQPSYFMLAELYLKTNQPQQALVYMKQAADLAPNFLQAQLNLAATAISVGDDAIAQDAVRRVIEIRKTMSKAYDTVEAARDALIIGGTYLQVQKFGQALEFYKRASELQPENAQYHAYLADVYTRLGDRQNAIAEAKEAARLNPGEYGAAAEAFIKQLSQ